MSDAFSDGRSVVNEVSQNGGESAARMLMDNINNARDDFSQPGLNKVSGGFNNYMTVLSDELQRSGVLPELTVGWAKANIDVIGNGRSITDNDIKKFEHNALNSNNPVDQMFIHSLKDQAPVLKDFSNDERGKETIVTSADLNNRLESHSGYRETVLPEQMGTNPNALRGKELLANGGEFFDYLDGIRNDGQKDGQVSRNDLVTFNERVKHDPEYARLFSPDQIQVAKELDERWDYEGDKIHTNGIFTQNMTRETIAKGIGFEDIPAERLMEHTFAPATDEIPADEQVTSRQLWAPEEELSLRDHIPVNPAGNNRVLEFDNPYADRINEPRIDNADPIRNLMNDATQRVGEGPYQVASRLLPGASHREIMELTRAMKNDYQDRTGDHSDRMVQMKVGERMLTPENLQRMISKSPALASRVPRGGH